MQPSICCVEWEGLEVYERDRTQSRLGHRQLGAIIARADKNKITLEEAARAEVVEMKVRGGRLAGFGHRIHTQDPRTKNLFELADVAGVSSKHVATARAVENEFAATGK